MKPRACLSRMKLLAHFDQFRVLKDRGIIKVHAIKWKDGQGGKGVILPIASPPYIIVQRTGDI